MSPAAKSDLEDAITEASNMADLTARFAGETLGLDNLDPPRLNNQEANLLLFAIQQVSSMLGRIAAQYEAYR